MWNSHFLLRYLCNLPSYRLRSPAHVHLPNLKWYGFHHDWKLNSDPVLPQINSIPPLGIQLSSDLRILTTPKFSCSDRFVFISLCYASRRNLEGNIWIQNSQLVRVEYSDDLPGLSGPLRFRSMLNKAISHLRRAVDETHLTWNRGFLASNLLHSFPGYSSFSSP